MELEYVDAQVREGERVDAMYKTFLAAGAAIVGSEEGVRMLDEVREEFVERVAGSGETPEERMDRLISIYQHNEQLNEGFDAVERAAKANPGVITNVGITLKTVPEEPKP